MRLLTIIFVLFSVPALAQGVDISRMTKEQLQSLTKEQMAQVPLIEFLERVGDMNRTQGEMVVATLLSRLMFAAEKPVYPFGPYVEAAMREFQSDIGARQDGRLKFAEFEEVRRRVQLLDRTANPIFPPFQRQLYQQSDFLTFGGTWVIEGENHAFPINYSDAVLHLGGLLDRNRGLVIAQRRGRIAEDHQMGRERSPYGGRR
jgi:hypothetical protein